MVVDDWNLRCVGVYRAWDLLRQRPTEGATLPAAGDPVARPGAGVRIGLLDTGVFEHPALRGAVDWSSAWDAQSFDRDVTPTPARWRPLARLALPDHGTEVASVIVGRGEVVGVAPGAVLVPVRAGDHPLQLIDSSLTAAVNYIRSPRLPDGQDADAVHVISMSFGGRWLLGLRETIRAAIEEGAIVVAAAGNGGMIPGLRGTISQPASFPEVICVAATGRDGRPWRGSCRGPEVDVAAPGADVATVTISEAGPGTGCGTSFAVAHVAGAAALWLSYHDRMTLIDRYGKHRLQQVFLHVLRASARRPDGWEDGYGTGILDVEHLLRAPLPALDELEAFPRDRRRPRYRFYSAMMRPVFRLVRPRFRYRILGGMYDPGARGRPRSALQKHVDPFDLNRDGVITFLETVRALRRLGFSRRKAVMSAGAICIVIGWRTWNGPALTINADAIHRALHPGTSEAFGRDGKVDRAALEELRSFDTKGDGLDAEQVDRAVAHFAERDRERGLLNNWWARMTTALMSAVELPLLREMFGGADGRGRLALRDLDAFFEGDLLRREIERPARSPSGSPR